MLYGVYVSKEHTHFQPDEVLKIHKEFQRFYLTSHFRRMKWKAYMAKQTGYKSTPLDINDDKLLRWQMVNNTKPSFSTCKRERQNAYFCLEILQRIKIYA